MLNTISNIAGILTAIIAIGWFIYTRKNNFFEKSNIIGVYKIFKSLVGRSENELAIIELSIDYISNKGWFMGRIDYAEIFRPPGARSEGGYNCIGYINYSLITDLVSSIAYSTKNPLDFDHSNGYRGKLYIISRNDFDLTRNWKDFLLESFDLTLYRNTFRIAIKNKKSHNEVKSQLQSDLVLVNTNYVKDNMYEMNTKTEFDHYPGF